MVSVSNSHVNIAAAKTNKVLLAIKNTYIFNGLKNTTEIALKSITITSAKSATNAKAITTFSISRGGTPDVDIDWQYVDSGSSAVLVGKPTATSGDGSTTLSTLGKIIHTGAISAEDSLTMDLTSSNGAIINDNTMYIIYSCTGLSGSNDIDLSVSLTWIEDH